MACKFFHKVLYNKLLSILARKDTSKRSVVFHKESSNKMHNSFNCLISLTCFVVALTLSPDPPSQSNGAPLISASPFAPPCLPTCPSPCSTVTASLQRSTSRLLFPSPVPSAPHLTGTSPFISCPFFSPFLAAPFSSQLLVPSPSRCVLQLNPPVTYPVITSAYPFPISPPNLPSSLPTSHLAVFSPPNPPFTSPSPTLRSSPSLRSLPVPSPSPPRAPPDGVSRRRPGSPGARSAAPRPAALVNAPVLQLRPPSSSLAALSPLRGLLILPR